MNKDYIGKIVDVVMDRPLGTKHPKHGFIYEVNYGYIPNTISGDGEELDAYVLGQDKRKKHLSSTNTTKTLVYTSVFFVLHLLIQLVFPYSLTNGNTHFRFGS